MSSIQKPIPPEWYEKIIQERWLDCKDFHSNHTCLEEAVERWFKVAASTYKYYIPIHLIPFLLFKLKHLKKDPTKTITKATISYVKSICFMSTYIAILKYTLCKAKNIRGRIDGVNPMLGAFFGAWGILWESESRRVEIALFIMTRFFETVWNYLKHRGYVKPIWSGENIVFAFAMGVIGYFYHCEQKSIKPSYLSLFKRFWGEN